MFSQISKTVGALHHYFEKSWIHTFSLVIILFSSQYLFICQLAILEGKVPISDYYLNLRMRHCALSSLAQFPAAAYCQPNVLSDKQAAAGSMKIRYGKQLSFNYISTWK